MFFLLDAPVYCLQIWGVENIGSGLTDQEDLVAVNELKR